MKTYGERQHKRSNAGVATLVQGIRWGWQHRAIRAIALLLGVCLLVRGLPYLAPIRASDLARNQQAIAFVDRSGLPLGTILTSDQEHAVSVPLSQISPHFQHAIIAAEDGRFYQHGAVDLWAIARALKEAIRAKQVMSGASTITMQLARMIDPAPRTLKGKLHEIWTSWRLAAGMSKAEILAAYSNRLPMGSNIYGIEAAARIYFGVPASDLSVGQASLLAGVPNDPNRLNPYTSWLASRERQTYVLSEMVKDGYLTQAQAQQAQQETITLQPRQQGIFAAPHLLFWLAGQLPDSTTSLRTTLDRPLQQFVEAQMKQVLARLAPQNVQHGAAIVLDNHTGDVLAYVGSPDYFADDQQGRNDGVQALRQPGSALKPFLYQLAIANRSIQATTILADVPTRYAIPGAKLYTPADYNEKFQGPVRVRVALANSLNIPAVRVLEKVGVASFLERLHQLGFAHLDQSADHYGLGLALGSGEVSLWEIAHAYQTMARQGAAIAPYVAWAEPKDAACKVAVVRCGGDRTVAVQQATQPVHSEFSTASWALVTDMLSDPYARAKAFGVNSLLSLPFPAAVKTGTSSDFRDTWTIGFTKDYTVAVWVGNFDGSPMRQVSGVTGSAPLWNRIMIHLHEGEEPSAFSLPAELVKRPICAISGARPTPACPTVVEEYVFQTDLAAYETQADPFYPIVSDGKGGTTQRLTLPVEYAEWLAQQPDQTGDRVLQILSPQNGDVFLLEPTSATRNSAQKLEFRLAAAAQQPIEWQLNGRAIATQAHSSLMWNPTPGSWTLQVKQGDATDTVRFEVSYATQRQERRGFSYGKGEGK